MKVKKNLRTLSIYEAYPAKRLTGMAAGPPVTVENVAYGDPSFLGNKDCYIPLNNFGPVRLSKAHTAGNPGKMSVHNDGGKPEAGGAYHTGGFPAHSR
jgi:hypothetical protein